MEPEMKKLLFAATLLLASLGACAQSLYLENSGRIFNRVDTSASVIGNGTSNSVARGAESASATGAVYTAAIPGGLAASIFGAVETQGSGMAFNVSTGNGTGAASSVGWSDANVNGFVNFANEHGTLHLDGFTDSGMAAPVGHGVDISVVAGRSQDGYAAGADGGSFAIVGQTSQLPIAGGAVIAASLSDVKTSHASVEAGAVSFMDGTPAGQSAAFRSALSGNVSEANGSFRDPFGAQ